MALIASSLLLTRSAGAQVNDAAVTATAPAAGSSLQLNVVVGPPAGGEPVANLPQSAFTVLDNGQPQPIQSFRAVSGKQAASELLLVVDSVNIRYTQLAYERQQIQKFLKQNEGQLALPTSLTLVSDTKTEITGATTDGNGLSNTLSDKVIGLRDLTRSSGFYGAEERLDISLKALHEVLAHAAATPGHKIVIWISPGWPLLSGPAVELTNRQEDGIFQEIVNLSAEIHRANVTLYSVNPLGAQESVGRTFYYEQFVKGVRKPSDASLGNLGVQVLAAQSGGLVLNSSNDTRELLQRAVADTAAEYTLTLAPSAAAPDGKNGYHSLEVRVANLPNSRLKVRTDQGFYTLPSTQPGTKPVPEITPIPGPGVR